jgi:hypothetical protein
MTAEQPTEPFDDHDVLYNEVMGDIAARNAFILPDSIDAEQTFPIERVAAGPTYQPERYDQILKQFSRTAQEMTGIDDLVTDPPLKVKRLTGVAYATIQDIVGHKVARYTASGAASPWQYMASEPVNRYLNQFFEDYQPSKWKDSVIKAKRDAYLTHYKNIATQRGTNFPEVQECVQLVKVCEAHEQYAGLAAAVTLLAAYGKKLSELRIARAVIVPPNSGRTKVSRHFAPLDPDF